MKCEFADIVTNHEGHTVIGKYHFSMVVCISLSVMLVHEPSELALS